MSDGMLERQRNVEALFEQFNDFSFIFSGIGSIVAGGILLMICLLNWLLKSNLPALILTIGLSTGWIFCNEVLRRTVYPSLDYFSCPTAIPYRYFGKGSLASSLSAVSKVLDWLMIQLRRYWRIPIIVCFALVIVSWVLLNIVDGGFFRLTFWIAFPFMFFLPFFVGFFLHSFIEVFLGYILMMVCISSSEGRLGAFFSTHPQPFFILILALIPIGALGHWGYSWYEKRFAEV